MRSVLVVTTPAASLALLTVAELRAAAGITGTTQDAALVALGLRVATSIAAECGVVAGRGREPTLLQETLTETFFDARSDELRLARRHNVEVVSLTADGIPMNIAVEVQVDPESGMLWRLSNDRPVAWCSNQIVVVYKAGFAEVPGDIRQAAIDFVSHAYRESQRDPALKSEEIEVPDVERRRRDFWIGAIPGQNNEGAVPAIVAGQLGRYRNYVIG